MSAGNKSSHQQRCKSQEYKFGEFQEREHAYAQTPVKERAQRHEARSSNAVPLRIVMLGKTGSGKSATGNSLIGEKTFESEMSGQSVTKECKIGEAVVNGCAICVIDTPGLFDTKLSPDQVNHEIVKCVRMTFPGPHIFLIILQIGRFTEEEIETFNRIFYLFGKDMGRFSVIVFTRLDELNRENKSLKKYINDTGPLLKQFVKLCGRNYIGIDNTASKELKSKQIEELIELIKEKVEENENTYFSNDLYKQAEVTLREIVSEDNIQAAVKGNEDGKSADDDKQNVEVREIKSRLSVQISPQKQFSTDNIRSCTSLNKNIETEKFNSSFKLRQKMLEKDLDERRYTIDKTLDQMEQLSIELDKERQCIIQNRELIIHAKMNVIADNMADANEKQCEEIDKMLYDTKLRLREIKQKLKDKNIPGSTKEKLTNDAKHLKEERDKLTHMQRKAKAYITMFRQSDDLQQQLSSRDRGCILL